MANSKSSNRLVVPGAREAMNKFKMEAASSIEFFHLKSFKIITDKMLLGTLIYIERLF